ncbi:MAG: VCBS repeat-containing protein [Planctomycetes bacterium]|nr:VCBS repeat-containing protein [Planctomycetota bacterium]
MAAADHDGVPHLAFPAVFFMLYRDLKLANLLIDGRGGVWVSDFGLAKAKDDDDLTQSGEVVGTLRYMALFAALGAWLASPRRPLLPNDLAIADLNGDAKPDLAIANTGDQQDLSPDSIALFFNRGGSFGRARKLPAGDLPFSLAALDLNGDRAADLLWANQRWRDLVCLYNGGSGRFAAGFEIPFEDYPGRIAAGDLDGDGRPDLAHITLRSNSLTILWNGGGTGWGVKTVLETGPGPNFINIIDVDGDGKNDLVTTNAISPQSIVKDVSVLRSQGSRRFEPAVHYKIGGSARDFAAGDLDGDRHLDLAVAHESPPGISILKNRGEGAYAGEAAEISTGFDVSSVAIGDFDRDGQLDLAGAGDLSFVGLLLNLGDGTFEKPISLGSGFAPLFVRTDDLDGDGSLDLAVTNVRSDSVTIFYNDGKGGFARTETLAAGGRLFW